MRLFLSGMLALPLAACQSAGMPEMIGTVNDPLEPYNRGVFDTFLFLDRNLLRPAAIVYRGAVPRPVRISVGNLLENLDSPKTFANDVLRGRIDQAGTTFGRFAINSTAGIAGLFDVADRLGLKRHEDDFGKTLATYGVDEGPYLFFILLGPTNVRDLTGSVVDFFFNPFLIAGWSDWAIEQSGDFALTFLATRERNIELLDETRRTSTDFYATVRDAYEQYRRNQLREEAGEPQELPEF